MNSEARKRAQENAAGPVAADVAAGVEVFRSAWLAADARGFRGHRVEAGIRALLAAGWTPPATCRCTMLRAATPNEPAEWEQADDCPVHPVKAIEVQPCPECRAGKHLNCDGRSWDFVADEPAPCPCCDKGGA